MRKSLVCLAFFATIFAITFAATPGAHAQQPAQSNGARSFTSRCSGCHGGNGTGSDRAPAILNFISSNSDEQIAALIRKGYNGMPAHNIADPEMKQLLEFLHTLRSPAQTAGGPTSEPQKRATVKLKGGRSLEGAVLNQTPFDMQLQTADGKIHRLTRIADIYQESPLTPKQDWPSYDGGYTGNRHSSLDQINRSTVKRLALQWIFPVPKAPRLEATPVVEDGIMYVTAANETYALDAVTGRQLWVYRQPRTPGLLGEAAGGANRGVALSPTRVFMMTDHAHLLALDRATGKLVWDQVLGDYLTEAYSATGAPLVIGDLVFAGVGGGEEGVRGLIDAYNISTGERVWRFWTIPAPGETGKVADTWSGSALLHGCGATWMSGAYDPQLDLLYWTVGNPCPDYNGDDRQGDNLYTASVLALRPKTGELKWYFQFTPHDTKDWDASEPTILADESFGGRPRKLLLQANRNGFYYVLDRETGEFLFGKPFVDRLTWASGLDQNGRPIRTPNSEPTLEGARICPGSAANWMSASFHPGTKLMYVNASDSCSVTKKIPAPWELGKRYFNGTATEEPGTRRMIRALDIKGNTVWDYPLLGRSASGTLSTNGGLVFFGESTGSLVALDARTGEALWHFQANQEWRASPMTYMVGGKQYVSLAGPSGYFTFALMD
ncbi:MAG TPA: PQQ-binding-like beta-propeller repeat protein [Terriglobales bacterium]|nr:PQQ-binding-like beta-propeller repeat protein [Terriglobales bacterium]